MGRRMGTRMGMRMKRSPDRLTAASTQAEATGPDTNSDARDRSYYAALSRSTNFRTQPSGDSKSPRNLPVSLIGRVALRLSTCVTVNLI